MPIHILKLLERKEVATNTLVLRFEKPNGLTFIPGQYAGFTLIEPSETDAGGITRRFSLLSTPDDAYIEIATRIQTSAYKRVLTSLKPGSQIKFAGPTGAFILHDDLSIPAVLIAGGIGISPFYSMIRYHTTHHLKQSIHLFYGNQSPSDAPFLEELNDYQKQNDTFKFVPTMAVPDETWYGETGFITDVMIKKYIPELTTPYFYICGSPTMVTTLQETLVEMGIHEEKIKVEDFPGY